MDKGNIQIYCGDGKGKTKAAAGYAMNSVSQGKSVIYIQFLKGRTINDMDFFKKLEPEIKFFVFEKNEKMYDELSSSEQDEEKMNILNGVNFARKVVSTGGADVVILDEILGLSDLSIIEESEIISLIESKYERTELVLTGRKCPILPLDSTVTISKIETL